MSRAPGGLVQWVGAQRDVLHGDIQGRIALSELRSLPHLYAVGPREGVTGEVSVFDGMPVVARIVAGAVTIEADAEVKACFLVYASVPRWQETSISTPLLSEGEIEGRVCLAASSAGLDARQPVPFLLRGTALTATCHVLDKRDGLPHTPERHEHAKVRFTNRGVPVEVVGFHSQGHRGIFTPRDANVHMHLRTRDNCWSGHLEHLQLAPGWTLGVPSTTEEDVS
jgi:acetolactate decarboxylase